MASHKEEAPRDVASAGPRDSVRAAKLNTPTNAPSGREFQAPSSRRRRLVGHAEARPRVSVLEVERDEGLAQ